MGLILRVDIDKPYGHHSLATRILSKLREDYYFPALNVFGYLQPCKIFLNFCNQHKIPALLYFRNCTIPNIQIQSLISEGDYLIGFHAENTRSIQTFQNEFSIFEKAIGQKITTFTKHGSGQLKLGKYHYAPFEPEKYKKWALDMKLDYSLGNGITSDVNALFSKNSFYENMFWMEHPYRRAPLSNIEDILDASKNKNIVLVIHPANFYTFPEVRKDLERLILYAKQLQIEWLNHIEY